MFNINNDTYLDTHTVTVYWYQFTSQFYKCTDTDS